MGDYFKDRELFARSIITVSFEITRYSHLLKVLEHKEEVNSVFWNLSPEVEDYTVDDDGYVGVMGAGTVFTDLSELQRLQRNSEQEVVDTVVSINECERALATIDCLEESAITVEQTRKSLQKVLRGLKDKRLMALACVGDYGRMYDLLRALPSVGTKIRKRRRCLQWLLSRTVSMLALSHNLPEKNGEYDWWYLTFSAKHNDYGGHIGYGVDVNIARCFSSVPCPVTEPLEDVDGAVNRLWQAVEQEDAKHKPYWVALERIQEQPAEEKDTE
jgi:hypothetical protein